MTNRFTVGRRYRWYQARYAALLLLTCVPLVLTGCGGGGGGSSSSGGENGGGGSISFPTSFNISDLGTFGGVRSDASAINDSGQVVGSAQNSSGAPIAFLYSNSQKKGLGTLPGGAESGASAINAAGQIVGGAETSPNVFHAVYFQVGSTTGPVDLGALPGDHGLGSSASVINAQGQIAGDSGSSAPNYHAALFSFGSTTPSDLGTLGGLNTQVAAINDSGEIVGYSTVSTGSASGLRHAVIFHIGSTAPTDMGTLGGNESFATSVNKQGQIVGISQTSTSSILYHAFVYSGGKMKDLGTFSGNQSSALKIDDNGLIFGTYSVSQSNTVSYFLYDTKTGKATDLGDLHARLSVADQALWSNLGVAGINSKNQICGTGTIGGRLHAFLMTPVVTGN